MRLLCMNKKSLERLFIQLVHAQSPKVLISLDDARQQVELQWRVCQSFEGIVTARCSVWPDLVRQILAPSKFEELTSPVLIKLANTQYPRMRHARANLGDFTTRGEPPSIPFTQPAGHLLELIVGQFIESIDDGNEALIRSQRFEELAAFWLLPAKHVSPGCLARGFFELVDELARASSHTKSE